MSFSRGLQTGTATVNAAIDRQKRDQQEAEFSRIYSENPVSYVEEDTAQMEAMASARKPDGTPYYSINQNPDGTRGYVPNFEYEGMPTKAAATSRPVAPVVVDPKVGTLRQGQADTLQQPQEPLAPQAMAAPMRERHRFMGKDYDKAPTEREQLRAKTLAYADVLGRTDPRQAMALRQDQARLDMSEEEHKWRGADAQHTQNQRAKAEALEKGWQEKFSEMRTILETKGVAGLVDSVGGWFSQDGSGIPMMLVHDEKTGRITMTSNVPGIGGRTKDLSVADVFGLAQGMYQMGNGDPQAGLKMVLDIERAKRAEGRQDRQDYNTAVQAVAGQANVLRDDARQERQVDYNIMSGDRKHELDVSEFGHRRNVDQRRLNNEGARLRLAGETASQQANAQRAQNTTYLQRPDGSMVAVTPVVSKTGEVTYKEQPLSGQYAPRTSPGAAARDPAKEAEVRAAYDELKEAGNNPQSIAEVKAKYPGVFGEDPMLKAFRERISGGPAGAKPTAPAAPAKPSAAISRSTPARPAQDPLAQQFQAETAAIEAGRLSDYSPEVKQWAGARDRLWNSGARGTKGEAVLDRQRREAYGIVR